MTNAPITSSADPAPTDSPAAAPTALVTGGSRGLGRATAVALAAAGVNVVVTYRSEENAAKEVVDEVTAAGRHGAALQLGLTDIGSFPAFADSLRAQLPDRKLDILVNNAGGALYSMLATTTEAEFDRVFTEHVKAPLFLTQALLPLLAEGARIVNISTALTRVSFPASGPYAAAKAALETLTRYQAVELAERKITANVVAAGAVPTDFGDGHLRSDAALQETIVRYTALKRLATPEDIGQLVAGLTTGSGRWFTGQRIEASGGLML